MTTHVDATRALDRLLRGDLEAVIFEVDDVYVQFAGDLEDVRCEAVGDRNLPEMLTFEQLQGLSRLRYYPPAPGSAGNHWQHFAGVPAACLAKLALATLANVFGADAASVTVREI